MKKQLKKFGGYLLALLIGGMSVVALNASDEPEGDHFEISKNLEIFSTLFRELSLYYVDDTDPGKLMKKGVDAMLKSLDPYTNYIPESKMEDYRFMTTGEYGGIGATISKRGDHVMVSSPYEGFPAHKAGLMAGDKILKVDGKSIEGMSVSEVSDILKGPAETEVTVTLDRMFQEEPLEKTIIRKKVTVPSVPYSGMLNDTVGYIRLRSFTRTSSEDVKKAFKDLKEQGMEQLVFDLRNNGGGLLKEAVNITNFFVPKGQEIVSTKGRIDRWNKSYKALNEPLDTTIHLAVLVNGNSASASEIVSGSVQDLDRGVVVGRRTYGKGLVQQTRDLYYNSKLKLTVAKYYIPSGRCIQEVDYTHRDISGDRDPEEVPDSLIKSYYTENGREVLDAEGIHPDIKVSQERPSKLTQLLLSDYHIFDAATRYRLQHDTIQQVKGFRVPDKAFRSFKEELMQEELEYRTDTEKKLEELEKTAKQEKYFEHAEAEFESLHNSLKPDKEKDFEKFGEEIREILSQEIVSRFRYQEGRIKASLGDDSAVDSALTVLQPRRYRSILSGPGSKNKD